MKGSKLVIQDHLPTPEKVKKSLSVEHLICIYDQNLLNFPHFINWLSEFEKGFSVVAGEDLKDLKNFPALVEKLLPSVQSLGRKQIGFVVVGGGTIGDTFGFLASVLKRGVKLFSLPSTWLAALDSAHGGKTALNVGVLKNQIGTFYPAHEVWIAKELLATQSTEQFDSAFGELAKMALLVGGNLFRKLESKKTIDLNFMWAVIPEVVRAKNLIVRKDPFEEKGVRYALNLGHTFGHALELHHHIPHGEAVRLGLMFAVEWGHQLGLTPDKDHKRMAKVLSKRPRPDLVINRAKLSEALRHDKKIASQDSVSFVFIKKPGDYLIKNVSVSEIVEEAVRQKWAK